MNATVASDSCARDPLLRGAASNAQAPSPPRRDGGDRVSIFQFEAPQAACQAERSNVATAATDARLPPTNTAIERHPDVGREPVDVAATRPRRQSRPVALAKKAPDTLGVHPTMNVPGRALEMKRFTSHCGSRGAARRAAHNEPRGNDDRRGRSQQHRPKPGTATRRHRPQRGGNDRNDQRQEHAHTSEFDKRTYHPSFGDRLTPACRCCARDADGARGACTSRSGYGVPGVA